MAIKVMPLLMFSSSFSSQFIKIRKRHFYTKCYFKLLNSSLRIVRVAGRFLRYDTRVVASSFHLFHFPLWLLPQLLFVVAFTHPFFISLSNRLICCPLSLMLIPLLTVRHNSLFRRNYILLFSFYFTSSLRQSVQWNFNSCSNAK